MAFINCKIFSASLHRYVEICLIFPSNDYGHYINIKRPLKQIDKILFLMCGIGESADIWRFQEDLENRSATTGTVIVLLDHYNAFAVDLGVGQNYLTYFGKEIFDFFEHIFQISRYIKKYYVAGVSLGGYNAITLGLSFPEKYSGVFSFSGLIDPFRHLAAGENYILSDACYLEKFFKTSQLGGIVPNGKGTETCFYLYCGTEDLYFKENYLLTEKLVAKGYRASFIPQQDKKHDWICWRQSFNEMWEIIGGTND